MPATIDHAYRYKLNRYVGPNKKLLLWVMLNPSTADDVKDDPTIRKVIGFTRRFGFGRLMVVNLFAKRATDPRDLFRGEIDPVGPENGLTLFRAIQIADTVVVAWGAFHASIPTSRRVQRPNIEAMAKRLGKEVHCLGTTKDGHPRHPLYVPYTQPLVLFDNDVANLR